MKSKKKNELIKKLIASNYLQPENMESLLEGNIVQTLRIVAHDFFYIEHVSTLTKKMLIDLIIEQIKIKNYTLLQIKEIITGS